MQKTSFDLIRSVSQQNTATSILDILQILPNVPDKKQNKYFLFHKSPHVSLISRAMHTAQTGSFNLTLWSSITLWPIKLPVNLTQRPDKGAAGAL